MRCDACDELLCTDCGRCPDCDGCQCDGPTDEMLEDQAHYGYAEPFLLVDKDTLGRLL